MIEHAPDLPFSPERTRACLRGRVTVKLAAERTPDSVEVVSEPHAIFSHEDDTLGPAGTTEWHAFIRDSEGNTVGLISFERES